VMGLVVGLRRPPAGSGGSTGLAAGPWLQDDDRGLA